MGSQLVQIKGKADEVPRESSLMRLLQLKEVYLDRHPRMTTKDFEKACGVSNGYFNTRVKGEKKPMEMRNVSHKLLKSMAENLNDPTINWQWVEDGIGEMFFSEEDVEAIAIAKDPNRGVPYYDVDFLGGFDEMWNDQTTTPTYYINLQPYNKKGNLWCNITGDSMSPRINSGDKICLQPLERGVEDIVYGEIYGIITTGGLRTIKWVVRSENENCIRLVPENKEPRYGDYQDFRIEDVFKVFKVLGAVRTF